MADQFGLVFGHEHFVSALRHGAPVSSTFDRNRLCAAAQQKRGPGQNVRGPSSFT